MFQGAPGTAHYAGLPACRGCKGRAAPFSPWRALCDGCVKRSPRQGGGTGLRRVRVDEKGTHDELIAQHGTYYQLYTGAFELE